MEGTREIWREKWQEMERGRLPPLALHNRLVALLHDILAQGIWNEAAVLGQSEDLFNRKLYRGLGK